ncbi:MAG: methyltransferase [Defluviitaleaceae bacterium]|nr:methyltransferase [Defluviitaleaceae bacterium]MCL2275827.1 methyltransferase [Defluviitaleaceae bacterium]
MKNGESHYFIANPALAGDTLTLQPVIFGQNLTFATARGLFSYEKPDAASLLLMEVMRATQPPISGTMLDLGCGYGLIGITLAKTHAAPRLRLTMSDTNEIACAYASQNAKKNGVQATVVHCDGFAAIADMFDTITLNPPIHAGKEIMYRLYKDAAAHLQPKGALYIVIQKKHGAESTINFLHELYPQVGVLHKRKGYYILRCTM